MGRTPAGRFDDLAVHLASETSTPSPDERPVFCIRQQSVEKLRSLGGHWADDEFQHVIAMFDRMLNLDWAKVTRDAIKKSTFVNCWYRSDYESAAMWTIYGKEGVALKSTVNLEKLVNAIHVNPLAEPWLRNVVETEAKLYGLDNSVVRSSLYDPV